MRFSVQPQTLVELEDKAKDGEQQEAFSMRNPAVHFLLEQVVVWLAEKGRKDTEHVVEMLFSSLYCCSCQETTRILNHVTTVTTHAESQYVKSLVVCFFLSFALLSSRWVYSGESSCRSYRGYVSDPS